MSVYPTTATATNIINAVAADVGLSAVSDPFSSGDQNYTQLISLLNRAGDELTMQYTWQFLMTSYAINVVATDTGEYDLPADFLRFIPQTLWDTTNQRPLVGPLQPYQWASLEADNVNAMISWGYRVRNGRFDLYPNNPTGRAANITFEYVSNKWVMDSDGSTLKNSVVTGNDTPLYHRNLIEAYLKLKWYISKNMDATAAQDDFNQVFGLLTGADTGGAVLDAGGGSDDFPYINMFRNVSDTGYGS